MFRWKSWPALFGRPRLAATLPQERPKPSATYLYPGDLTPGEHEVLALMVEGMNNPEIAARLVVIQFIVKFHVGRILSKLGVTRRTEAIALAVQHHLVT